MSTIKPVWPQVGASKKKRKKEKKKKKKKKCKLSKFRVRCQGVGSKCGLQLSNYNLHLLIFNVMKCI